MSSPSRPARALPAVPNLEQQRRQARELLTAARAGDPEAIARIRAHHPRLSTPAADPPDSAVLSLHDSQLVLAREYGFPSWPKLKAHIEAVVASRRTHPVERDLEYYEERARGLLTVLADGAPDTLDQVRSWHPGFAGAGNEVIRAAGADGTFTLDDARLVYAREHGFSSWVRLVRHLERLAAGEVTDPFIDLIEAGRNGDWRKVNGTLQSRPDLASARGTNGNTLLNLACSMLPCPAGNDRTGPAGLAADRLAPLKVLLAAGADPNQGNDRGWTPLHQAADRNDSEMAALLLQAGARPDLEAHGSGGTPLIVALFWGNREVSEMLAQAGMAPHNLRVAAGLLLDRGARMDADPYRGTPLLWAAAAGRADAVAWLIDHGAEVNQRATFGGPAHGEGVTALHLAAERGDVAMIELLLARGADRSVEDALYHSTPAGWAEHNGHDIPALRGSSSG